MTNAQLSPELSSAAREDVRDLVLALADSKRLLGMRYAEWMLGAPELEAGIACASMGQDEWGHARLLYALLKDFGEDVDRIEHGRPPEEYRSIEALDRSPESWPQLVALNALVDTALTVQLEALTDSSYAPLRQRVGKLLEEERFHLAHASAWFRRLAGTDAGRSALLDAVEEIFPVVARWFGPDSDRARRATEEGVIDGGGGVLRDRFLQRVQPLLEAIGAAERFSDLEPDFGAFDEAARRVSRSGPDAETVARVRGDRNRAFLLDS